MRPALIVAGGYSTRFGDEDKAIATLRGSPLVRHVADRLVDVIDTVVINCREDQLDPIADAMAGYDRDVAYAPDEEPGLGPVAGLETGLGRIPDDAPFTFAVACDMPFVEASLVEALFDRATANDAEAVVPRSADGWYQVLHAVYATKAMRRACRRALDAGERKLLAPLSYVTVDVVEGGELAGLERSFENVNTRAEFEAAATRLERS